LSLLFPFLLKRNIRDFKLSGLPKVVWDYKSWLEPHLCTDIKYMSVPHRFRIFLVAKKACLQYMHFSGGEWQPQKPAEFEIPILPGDIRNASVSLPDDPGKLFCTNFTLIS